MELPYNPDIPWLGIYPKNPEPPILKNLCTPTFIAVPKCWKQPKCPSEDGWFKKLWYICKIKYYAAETKRKSYLFVTAWMELETITLSEISQSAKDKYHYDFSYNWNTVNKINL